MNGIFYEKIEKQMSFLGFNKTQLNLRQDFEQDFKFILCNKNWGRHFSLGRLEF